MRYFVWFGYDGTRYHGWQYQPNGITVQEELERALSLLLREDIHVTGAGRTDTGVHARQMAAHFDTEVVFDCVHMVKRLNGVLRAGGRETAGWGSVGRDCDLIKTYGED